MLAEQRHSFKKPLPKRSRWTWFGVAFIVLENTAIFGWLFAIYNRDPTEETAYLTFLIMVSSNSAINLLILALMLLALFKIGVLIKRNSTLKESKAMIRIHLMVFVTY